MNPRSHLLLLAAVLLAATLALAGIYFPHGSAQELDRPPAGAAATATEVHTATFYTGIYNANFPYSVHIRHLDNDSTRKLVLSGVLTDYSMIATPNARRSWCNEWRLSSLARDGQRPDAGTDRLAGLPAYMAACIRSRASGLGRGRWPGAGEGWRPGICLPFPHDRRSGTPGWTMAPRPGAYVSALWATGRGRLRARVASNPYR